MIYSESDLIMPTLVYLSSKEDGILTSNLIIYLTETLKPEGKDLELSANRKDTRFSQKVRNIISHRGISQRSIFKKGLATYDTISKNKGLLKITDLGKKYISDNIDGFDFIETNGFSENDREKVIDQNFVNLIIEEGFIRSNHVKTRFRSKKLIEIAKEHFKKHNKIYCEACNFNFEEFYGLAGKGFIEIHHLKPIFAYEDNLEQSIMDALKNVVPVCSNCHRIIHRKKAIILSIEKLKDMIAAQK